ncbi:YkgJ family cysteine cluster protein [Pseudoduganella sp. GCM10020061]|uniref:YkgJ family cysteine cluster protein n=1 Tax=Pseudoduganella sp. GCM10020061 TaxID=3317345 RepID=UPI00363E5A82
MKRSKKLIDLLSDPQLNEVLLMERLDRISTENSSVKVRRAKIIKAVDQVGELLAPHVTCRPGCVTCCHGPVLIQEHEAKRLAEVTNRKMVPVSHHSPVQYLALAGERHSRPCPFLKDDLCSVYPHRPLRCRTHHTTNKNPKQCSTKAFEGGRGVVVHPIALEGIYLGDWNGDDPWGSIHEFFPD